MEDLSIINVSARSALSESIVPINNKIFSLFLDNITRRNELRNETISVIYLFPGLISMYAKICPRNDPDLIISRYWHAHMFVKIVLMYTCLNAQKLINKSMLTFRPG